MLENTSALPVGFFSEHINYLLNETINVQFGHPNFVPNPSVNGHGHVRLTFMSNPINIEVSLIGSHNVTVPLGSTYEDAGAILLRNGVDISYRLEQTGTVNTNVAGEYKITWSYTSAETNRTYTATRTVTVVSRTIPAPPGGTVTSEGVPVPAGFAVSTVPGEDSRDTGLVIIDQTNGNEFVWIPVTEEEYVKWDPYRTATLHAATTDDVLPIGVANEMDQIRVYGGFFIGRFSAGIPAGHAMNNTATGPARNVSTAASPIPVTQRNRTPWNFINYINSKVNAERMYTGTNVRSGLVTGRQYDSVMRWLEDAGYDVQFNSTSWGNFRNTEVTGITEHSANGATWVAATTKPANVDGIIRTGGTDFTRAQNIYDIAGNMSEWTTEMVGTQRVARSGGFNFVGTNFPAAHRSSHAPSAVVRFGFRPVLYLPLPVEPVEPAPATSVNSPRYNLMGMAPVRHTGGTTWSQVDLTVDYDLWYDYIAQNRSNNCWWNKQMGQCKRYEWKYVCMDT